MIGIRLSDYSYFLNNRDSAIFLNTSKLESATVVSQDMSKENSILKLTAGEESYHLLTLKDKKRYNLICDFYGKNKKYESELPIEYTNHDRTFIHKSVGDSIITTIGNAKYIAIVHSSLDGRSILYKKIDTVVSPIVSAGTISGNTYILQMEGRVKSGTIGRIKLEYY